MTELKTLKDIAYSGTNPQCPSELHFNVEALRQEAIKWVKRLSEKDPMYMDDKSVSEFIIDFFNLTEEDLK